MLSKYMSRFRKALANIARTKKDEKGNVTTQKAIEKSDQIPISDLKLKLDQ